MVCPLDTASLWTRWILSNRFKFSSALVSHVETITDIEFGPNVP